MAIKAGRKRGMSLSILSNSEATLGSLLIAFVLGVVRCASPMSFRRQSDRLELWGVRWVRAVWELMPTRNFMAKDEHNKAAEHHENAAKEHRSAAEHHGKGDHSKGREHASSAKQHSQTANQHSDQAHSKSQQQK